MTKKSEKLTKTEGDKPLTPASVSISSIAKEIHKNAIDHGWWDIDRNIPELLCLIHSEVSEALEAHRLDDDMNFEDELADIVIRVFDLAVANEIDIEQAIIRKNKYNINRSYKHGGKKC